MTTELKKAIETATAACKDLLKSHVSATTYTTASGTTVHREEYDRAGYENARHKAEKHTEATEYMGQHDKSLRAQKAHQHAAKAHEHAADMAEDLGLEQESMEHSSMMMHHNVAAEKIRQHLAKQRR